MAKKRVSKKKMHKVKGHKFPKKPKKPKRSASLHSWESYAERYKNWQHRCSEIVSDAKRKQSLIHSYAHC